MVVDTDGVERRHSGRHPPPDLESYLTPHRIFVSVASSLRCPGSGKLAVLPAVQYNTPRPTGLSISGDTMLEELIQKAESEFERIQRLRGYL
jgi:hypothetical protein